MMIGKISGQNSGSHISALNRSIAHKNEAITGRKQDVNQITAIISPSGKKQSMIEQLMKQKLDLTERINSLSTSASESTGNIQEQMKELRKQMEMLDEQIMKLQMESEEKKEDDQESGIYDKPMTKEEAESKKMNNILNLASSSDQMEVVSSVKGQVDGRTRVLKAEIKTGNGNIESKIEEMAKLESQSAGLASQLGQKIIDINDDVESAQDEAASEVSDSEVPERDEDDIEKEIEI